MIFTLILVIDGWAIFYEITLGWVSLHPTDNLVNTGPEEGLVLSGSKPLPEKKIDPDLCRCMTSFGQYTIHEIPHMS